MSQLTRNLAFGVALLGAACLAWFWMARQPPRLARALPEADAILYADLRPFHKASGLLSQPAFSAPGRSAEYQHFVDQTGIVPERDLSEIAMAVTRRTDPIGPNGPVAFTELFKGRFDQHRVSSYLSSLSSARETYAGHTIFVLPVDTADPAIHRLLRVTVLHPDTIAASNAPTAEQLHSLVDRDQTLFAASPTVLSALYRDVPNLSPVWALGQLGLVSPADPSAASSPISLLGVALPFSTSEPLVISLRYFGAVRLRVEAIASSPDTALEQAGALAGMVNLLRVLPSASSPHPLDPPLAATLNSLSVNRSSDRPNRVVITATLPTSLLSSLAGQGAP